MNTATHSVAALSPEAFALVAGSLFPCAPRYSRESVLFSNQGLLPSGRRVCALLRDFTLQALEFLDKLTLMLLPKGAVYFGTRRNMIELSNVLQNYSDGSTQNRKGPPDVGAAFIPMGQPRGLRRDLVSLIGSHLCPKLTLFALPVISHDDRASPSTVATDGAPALLSSPDHRLEKSGAWHARPSPGQCAGWDCQSHGCRRRQLPVQKKVPPDKSSQGL